MKYGVIGTNFVSDFFMNGAKQVEGCEVVAVCSKTQAHAQAFAQKYQIPHCFTSYEEMYQANLVDAVYVAVPNALHYEIATYFLERKIPTFCEKPLASNAREAAEMIACAKRNHTFLQEGLIPLFNPNYHILREHLGDIGPIRQVNLNFSKYSSRYDAYLRGENPTTFRADLANGATMDLGVYLVAFCLGLFQAPNKILSTAALLDSGADAAGSSIFQYDGFTVNLTYSKASDTKNICEICGEWGQLTIDQPSQPQHITLMDRRDQRTIDLSVPVKENFYYEIKEMMDACANGWIEAPSIPFALSNLIHETLSEMRRQSGIVFPMD